MNKRKDKGKGGKGEGGKGEGGKRRREKKKRGIWENIKSINQFRRSNSTFLLSESWEEDDSSFGFSALRSKGFCGFCDRTKDGSLSTLNKSSTILFTIVNRGALWSDFERVVRRAPISRSGGELVFVGATEQDAKSMGRVEEVEVYNSEDEGW